MKMFIVVMPRIEGNPDIGYRTEYYTDRRPWGTWQRAAKHGAGELDQSDDFLIGQVEGDRLVALQYMGEVRDDPGELANAAECMGMTL